MKMWGIEFGDLIAFGANLLITLGLFKKGEDNKLEVNMEAVRRIFPHFMGIGQNDEALFATAWSKLSQMVQRALRILLRHPNPADPADRDRTLSRKQRAVFILTVATMPSVDDQVELLEGLAILTPQQFVQAVEGMRLVPEKSELVHQIRQWLITTTFTAPDGTVHHYMTPEGEVQWDVIGFRFSELSARANAQLNIWGEEIETRAGVLTDRADALQQRVVEAGLARPETPFVERMTHAAIERREARRTGGWRQLIRSVTGF